MRRILLILTICFAFYSCDSDDYFKDGGISEEHVGMGTFDFLQSHEQLDTLAILIERAGLRDALNDQHTLFAPNNLSIKNYVNRVLTEMRLIDPQAEFTINDIPADTLEKHMGGYIFPQEITRDDLTAEGEIFTALNGDERRISLEPVQEYTGELGFFPEYVFYTYQDGDSWDPWDELDDDTKIRVRTSNLISTSGVIHVLQGEHVLFNYETAQ